MLPVQHYRGTVSNLNQRKKGPVTDKEQFFADKLNVFSCRFDQRDFSAEHQQATARVRMLPAEHVVVMEDDMRHAFRDVNSTDFRSRHRQREDP